MAPSYTMCTRDHNKDQGIATKLHSNGTILETSNTVSHILMFIKLEAVVSRKKVQTL